DEAAGELLAALLELVDRHAAVLEATVQVGEGVEDGILVDGCGLSRALVLVLQAGGLLLGLDERLFLLVALPLELPECGAAVGHGFPLPVDGRRGTARRRVREEDAASHVVRTSHASHSSARSSGRSRNSDQSVDEIGRQPGAPARHPPPYRDRPPSPWSRSAVLQPACERDGEAGRELVAWLDQPAVAGDQGICGRRHGLETAEIRI